MYFGQKKRIQENRSVAEPHLAFHTAWLCNKVKDSFKFFSIIYLRNLATLHSFHFHFSFNVCIHNSIQVDVVNSKQCYFFFLSTCCLTLSNPIWWNFCQAAIFIKLDKQNWTIHFTKCSGRFCKWKRIVFNALI